MTDTFPRSTPHRATPEQWDKRIKTAFSQWWYDEGSGMPPLPGHDLEKHTERMTEIAWLNGAYVAANGLKQEMADLELRARVEALEAQQQAQQPAAPEPDDSPNELVKQVANVFVDEEPNHESDSYFQSKARSQIRVVARWLRANGFDAAANRLEREAGR